MSFLKLNLILIMFVISVRGNIFDQILQTFKRKNEKVNCVMVIKGNDSQIVFEEATVPTIIMDLHDLPNDVEKNANIIGGHYGNELKRASKYEDSFDIMMRPFEFCIVIVISKCYVKFQYIFQMRIHFYFFMISKLSVSSAKTTFWL